MDVLYAYIVLGIVSVLVYWYFDNQADYEEY